jgi:hypothetical protein
MEHVDGWIRPPRAGGDTSAGRTGRRLLSQSGCARAPGGWERDEIEVHDFWPLFVL